MMNLREIASWPPFPRELGTFPRIVAGVPSLQRGLVWRAGQVELMWDSLARGFPIGSLVVCPKLTGLQRTRWVAGPEDEHITHHLLDGQQRAQAIRLGFEDPLASKSEVSLWLDLAPGKPGGTRTFRFRVTTKAHPWGYAIDDAARRLPVGKVRESIERCGFDPSSGNFEERPEPSGCWPIEAVAPVPVAWLMALEDDGDDMFTTRLASKCADISGTKPHGEWTSAVLSLLEDRERRSDLGRIWQAVRRLHRTTIPVLEVPQEVLSGFISGDTAKSAVAVAETMFQRLNGGGTPLDGDELTYSMIKAHWPGIERIVDSVAKLRKLPEARLVTLAARLPLSDGDDAAATVSVRIGVDAIRGLSIASNNAESDAADGKQSKRTRFESFFLHGGQFGLERVLTKVGSWCGTDADHDVPVVLQTAIARSTPDVYALLLWMADRSLRDGQVEAPGVSRRVQGVMTSLAWFSPDPRRAAAAAAAVLSKRGSADPDRFEGLLAAARNVEEWAARLPPSPEELEQLIPEPFGEPSGWALRERLAGDDSRKDSARRIASSRDMLLYAQRMLLRRKFPNYDPSRRDLWADHDRPWDFDHLLAIDSVNYQPIPNGHKKTALWDWSKHSVSNLRAWPFAQNRGDGSAAPSQKFDKDNLPSGMSVEEAMQLSFLNEEEKASLDEGFKFARLGGADESLQAFVSGARSRLLRIYREWYGPSGLDIGYLKGPDAA